MPRRYSALRVLPAVPAPQPQHPTLEATPAPVVESVRRVIRVRDDGASPVAADRRRMTVDALLLDAGRVRRTLRLVRDEPGAPISCAADASAPASAGEARLGLVTGSPVHPEVGRTTRLVQGALGL